MELSRRTFKVVDEYIESLEQKVNKTVKEKNDKILKREAELEAQDKHFLDVKFFFSNSKSFRVNYSFDGQVLKIESNDIFKAFDEDAEYDDSLYLKTNISVEGLESYKIEDSVGILILGFDTMVKTFINQ